MRALFLLIILLCFIQRAPGWGVLGHQAMARVAQQLLSNDVATTVQRILGTNDMAAVALWADQLRDAQRGRGPLVNNAEAREFNRRFPENRNWHFVNLPLGTLRYVRSSRFASTNDIVHALNRCLSVLQGDSQEMTKAQALRWLIHLVGDIHQPLHVSCGYYRFRSDGGIVLLWQPSEAVSHPHDLGGNILRFTASQNLHAYWDSDLVDVIDRSPANARLTTILDETLQPSRWKTSGARDRWPAKWASDAVAQARGIYKGIEFKIAQLDVTGAPTNIVIRLPDGYQTNQIARAKGQLSKSAFHLAEILNKLHWE
ncbi:MAG TPA: S1/P1 nuclease [Candidatus Binatia bacterium]|nr:S1/P1 nuclease [Candidatus Binatia bacterium]